MHKEAVTTMWCSRFSMRRNFFVKKRDATFCGGGVIVRTQDYGVITGLANIARTAEILTFGRSKRRGSFVWNHIVVTDTTEYEVIEAQPIPSACQKATCEVWNLALSFC